MRTARGTSETSQTSTLPPLLLGRCVSQAQQEPARSHTAVRQRCSGKSQKPRCRIRKTQVGAVHPPSSRSRTHHPVYMAVAVFHLARNRGRRFLGGFLDTARNIQVTMICWVGLGVSSPQKLLDASKAHRGRAKVWKVLGKSSEVEAVQQLCVRCGLCRSHFA